MPKVESLDRRIRRLERQREETDTGPSRLLVFLTTDTGLLAVEEFDLNAGLGAVCTRRPPTADESQEWQARQEAYKND